MRTIEREETCIEFLLPLFLFAFLNEPVTLSDKTLCFSKILSSQLTLNTNQTFYQWLILLKHLVVTLRNRTGDDQRCTGIINQHRVNLIDDGVVM